MHSIPIRSWSAFAEEGALARRRFLSAATGTAGGLLGAGLLAVRATQADDLAVPNAWIAAWNSHNADAVAALFTPDALYEDVPTGAVNYGTAQIRAFAQGFFTAVPDIHLELVGASLKGGHGTIEWVLTGTDQGIYRTGTQFRVRGVTVIDVHGTQISRNSDYWDLATLLREVGLLPAGL
jgi:steroid delta-isomerase-like uncharacterized protein